MKQILMQFSKNNASDDVELGVTMYRGVRGREISLEQRETVC